MSAGEQPWTGPGEDLRGWVFGRWVVTGPASADAGGVRVMCRCACGRIGGRYVADLMAGRTDRCRRCADSRSTKATLYRDWYGKNRARNNARRRARYAAKRAKKRCAMPKCSGMRAAHRTFCIEHASMPMRERAVLMGRKPRQRKYYPLTPAQVEKAKLSRRKKRAKDPTFRAREAEYARRYRARKKAREAREREAA